MKNILTLVTALVMSASAFAQKTTYCDVEVVRPAFKNYVAQVSFSDKPGEQSLIVKDEKGNTKKFKTEISVLGYFAEQGWELVNTVNYKGTTHFYLKKTA